MFEEVRPMRYSGLKTEIHCWLVGFFDWSAVVAEVAAGGVPPRAPIGSGRSW